MMDELEPQPVPVVEPEYKTTLTPEQLADALKEVAGRSFSGRHPELGKMLNCKVCGRRHRESEMVKKRIAIQTERGVVKETVSFMLRHKCEQVFTYSVKDKSGRLYTQHVEEEKDGKVTLAPLYRTAIPHGRKPTMKQILGAAATHKKRFKPHPSKTKLVFIEVVRKVFEGWEQTFNLNLDRVSDDELREKLETAYKQDVQNMLHRARLKAARLLRRAGYRLNWGAR
jgi:hypothetical protein